MRRWCAATVLVIVVAGGAAPAGAAAPPASPAPKPDPGALAAEQDRRRLEAVQQVAPGRADAAAPAAVNPVDGLEYLRIPAGSFAMGCAPADPDCDPGERPQHAVRIAAPYWMGRTEVTVEAYRRFLRDLAFQQYPIRAPEGLDAQAPQAAVSSVSWFDAARFCEWSGGRLPSEAEWEYAARGGLTAQRYPWGSEAPTCTEGAANGADHESCAGGAAGPAGRFARNGYGLLDVAGGLQEWCQDGFDATSYASLLPWAHPVYDYGFDRVLRGGSRLSSAADLRTSARNYLDGSAGDPLVGFRCARSREPQPGDAARTLAPPDRPAPPPLTPGLAPAGTPPTSPQ